MTSPALPYKPWFSIKEAVFYIGCSRMTVHRMIERGELEVRGLPFMRRISYQSLLKKLSQL